MNKQFIKYPDTNQYRSIVKNVIENAQYVRTDEDGSPVFDYDVELPILTFKGTVKLHGTNAGISYNRASGMWCQKRTSNVTTEKDNAGFAFFIEKTNEHYFDVLLQVLFGYYDCKPDDTITLYGEWCGKGIQKGVSINALPKMFVIFGLKITSEGVGTWIPLIKDHPFLTQRKLPENVYLANHFQTFSIDIDFNNPAGAQNRLVQLTEFVEKECPVGKTLGVPSDAQCTIGEGLVWIGYWKENRYMFKTKGTAHSKSSSKVKVLTKVDEALIKSIEDFVIRFGATESRLQQMFKEICNNNPNRKLLGDFLRAVFQDVLKEEIDIMKNFNLEPKQVSKKISEISRNWFFEQEKL